MLEAAKWLGYSNPWKITSVSLSDFDAKEGFNFAEEILEFLALFSSGSLEQLCLTGFHANTLFSMTHDGFFKKLPDLELFCLRRAPHGGFFVCF